MTPGDWIRRPPRGIRQDGGPLHIGRWHLVESVIATDAVTAEEVA